ncbi:MAG: cytochrome c-type biogenesis protein CcmH [Solirubrobacteraceae bacterium]|jgi:cytochrome c-type biogenesis protein CcmH|nr:cytochrome c-type biogenesis protein CcmH [Solirubrobacteraceae bacterium]MDP4673407.1 cytochrome c-type biogenesis protein CcmH [Solirubrobacteraceae bacterium]MDP5034074.1 cytochrome c-type biogenesis protein CcmH [Solirubrobacteraceae bacterium]
MGRKLKASLAGLLALGALASAAPAMAQVSFPDIENEVMCDTCNVPLNIAEAPRADQLRREINKLIARGQSKEQIKATLSERYGPAILALPPASGFSLTAYLVPLAVAIGLLLLGIVLLRRWRRSGRGGQHDEAPLDDEDASRLDDELERFGR